MIYEHLNYGENNGLRIEELKAPTGIENGRKIWNQILFERQLGYPIFKTPDKKFYLLERSGLNKKRAQIRKQIRETIKKLKEIPEPADQEQAERYDKREKELNKKLNQLECEESLVNRCLKCDRPTVEESSLSMAEMNKHVRTGVYSCSWQQSAPTPH